MSNWVSEATNEINKLQAAAKDNPKLFWGNKSLGVGEGLQRVRELLPAVKNLNQALSDLNRAI